MIGQGAAKTEVMSAEAVHRRDDLVQLLLLDRTINRVLAIWGRTPFEVVFVVDVCTGEKNLISELKVSQILACVVTYQRTCL